MCGSSSSPPFAIAAYAVTSCNGVTAISYPIRIDAAVWRDHCFGSRNVPAASAGSGTPSGMPNPRSRKVSYFCRGVSRWPNWTMPMLLENLITSASESSAALCMSLMTRPSSSSLPLWVLTMSVGRARLCSSSDAAMNGLSVEPGSNGSVTAVFPNVVRPTLLLASARISPVCGFITTMSPPCAPGCRRRSPARARRCPEERC